MVSCTCAIADSFNVRASDLVNPTCPLHGNRKERAERYVDLSPSETLAAGKIYLILADASQGTVDPDRALNIARRAVKEACDNREGK